MCLEIADHFLNLAGRILPKTEGTAPEKTAKGFQSNWPLLRKIETLVFACMLALLPVFASKVLDVTTTQLAVKNGAADLARDLSRAKTLAKEGGVNIGVVSRKASSMNPPAYLIQDDQRTIEEVLLPKGVSIDGAVKFDGQGNPTKPSSFTIKKGLKSTTILIDANGVISSP